MQSDPIGLDGGENSYLYAKGNSLRFVDKYGLWDPASEVQPYFPNIPDAQDIRNYNCNKMRIFYENSSYVANKRAAQGLDDGAKFFGMLGASSGFIPYPPAQVFSKSCLAASITLDTLKHYVKIKNNNFDPAEAAIDYAVPYSLKPYGEAVGEATSLILEEGYNYAEKNLR